MRAILAACAAIVLLSAWTACAEPAPLPPPSPARTLTLAQALRGALDTNVQVLIAREGIHEAEAKATQASAPLKPRLGFTAQEANVTLNLAAQGFTGAVFPNVPLMIGPFFSFDSRLRLAQTLINTSAVFEARKSRLGVTLARLQERLARNQVAAAVEVAYIDLLRARRAIEDARANLDLARALLALAEHQHAAGVATGLDVTRADTRLAEEQVALERATAIECRSRLNLQHLVGIPLGEQVALADPLRAFDEPAPSLDATLAAAKSGRIELQIGRDQVNQQALDVRAARARYGPVVGLAADYGVSGETPVNRSSSVHNVGLQVQMPLYDGGLTRGQIDEATSRMRQDETRLADLGVQVEQDVRLAIDGLQTSRAAVAAAARGLGLAEREVRMASDRFKAGLGDNIEVVAAQTALSNARAVYAAALAAWQTARANLAAAVGESEGFRLDAPLAPSAEPTPGANIR